MPRKSLAEELAELANPAPRTEHDPDADIFGATAALEASDDEILAAPKQKGKERSRLRGDIVLPGKEYAGRRSTRAAVFEDGEESDHGSEEEDEGSEEGGDDGIVTREDNVAKDATETSDEDEEDDINNDDDAVNQGKEDDEAADIEREYRAMQEQEADAMAGLQERAAKERRKGLAVAAQRSLWESGLEIRIMLQRALQSGNRFPQPESHRVAREVDPALGAAMEGLARDAAGVLVDMLSLLQVLEAQYPAVGEVAEAAGFKRKSAGDDDNDDDNDDDENEEDVSANPRKKTKKSTVDGLWRQLDDAYQRFSSFRDASIDRWHRKTVLSSGSAARGGLKALNQSVSHQVQTLMMDSGRIVERTRLPKRLSQPLCSTEDDQGGLGNGDVPDHQKGDAVDRIPKPDEGRDPETYDDGEFYQTLLKEFFEGKHEGGVNLHSGPKNRKLVDRRASKGRKLRYHIHEKLANFMTPVELRAPQFASNIFANLFGGAGQKRN